MQEVRNSFKIVVVKPKGKRAVQLLGCRGGIILTCILKKQGLKM
jgi:hypothetical protein